MTPTILYQDSLFFAINKPAAMPAQADKTGDPSALEWAEAECGQSLHPIHRLDRPASGVLLFGKTSAAMTDVQRQFQEQAIEKSYLAVVAVLPDPAEATLVHYLQKNSVKNRGFALMEPQKGAVRAEMDYRLLGSTDRYHLLQVRLLTGRHHQIRTQLSAIGCPIKGDVKYGARRGNRDRSISLHAWRLAFEHPGTGEWQQLEAPLPDSDTIWTALAEIVQNAEPWEQRPGKPQ